MSALLWFLGAAVLYGLFIHRGAYVKDRENVPFTVEVVMGLVAGVAVVVFVYCMIRGLTDAHLMPYVEVRTK